jgi:hypothetical protein
MTIPRSPESPSHTEEIEPLKPEGHPLGEQAVANSIEVNVLPDPDTIPSLQDKLHYIESQNVHLYDESCTVTVHLDKALETPPEDRTPEQIQLLVDLIKLREFAPHSTLYQYCYTPEELHGLVEALSKFSKKHRPDFNGLEEKIIDILVSALSKGEVDREDIPGLAQRADEDKPNRRGMQWGSLEKYAERASTVIRLNCYGVNRDYFIDVEDPNPTKKPALKGVYQFVADSHALEVIGQRNIAVQQVRKDAFVENCAIVNEWYAQVEPILAALPRTMRIEQSSVAWHIKSLVESMNTRLEGSVKYGRDKDYARDPAGAISLQKRIGHAVELVKDMIRKDLSVEEIIPLE